ncbi:MAG: hypothetical protein A2Z25_12025 [Planctomycetes bacterium RBG_16_55_9]|nr:MAG: hypothetical protein A2Z25_12025 [Planctomycetes bacterium RBG_16_55_9]
MAKRVAQNPSILFGPRREARQRTQIVSPRRASIPALYEAAAVTFDRGARDVPEIEKAAGPDDLNQPVPRSRHVVFWPASGRKDLAVIPDMVAQGFDALCPPRVQ